MKSLLLLLLVLTGLLLPAQNQNFCGSTEVTALLINKYPQLQANYNAMLLAERTATSMQARPQAQSAPQYTIPVVFHILHQGGPENISDAQVIDQVQILNRDYQKMNADTLLVVPTYTNNIANVGIAFQLAKIDPNGNCTNGIIRHYTSKTNWNANDLTEFTYTWPRNKYLNIYIVKTINIPATAYSFLPPVGVPPNADCIVCMHNNCGSIGTSNVALSRVITHETAHWLNIPHTWGSSNQPGVVCGDDGIFDTPITKGFVNCNLQTTKICNALIEENIQNYMDYSPCKIMFTNGQAAQMISCLTGALNNRNNISSPLNLLATGVTGSVGNCIPLVEIASKVGNTVCEGSPVPILSFTSNANATSYAWSSSAGASLSSLATESTIATFIGAGIYTISCSASNSNGSSTATMQVVVSSSVSQIGGTALESFESTALPNNWSTLHTPGSPIQWSIINGVSSHSASSAFINGEDATGVAVEILQSPSYDFLNNPGAKFSFYYAYARKSASHKDIFKVQASSDCGGTYKDIYTANSQQLSAGSGGIDNQLFYPTPQQWKNYVLSDHPNFIPFLSQNNVVIRFYFQEDSLGAGNRFYLDQINFESPVGLNEQAKHIQLRVVPNPSSENITLKMQLDESKEVTLTITNLRGETLYKIEKLTLEAGNNGIPIVLPTNLAKGLYLLTVKGEGIQATVKIAKY